MTCKRYYRSRPCATSATRLRLHLRVFVRAPRGGDKSVPARAVRAPADWPTRRLRPSPLAPATRPPGRPGRRRRGRPTAADLAIVRGERNYDCILPPRPTRASTARPVSASAVSTATVAIGASTAGTGRSTRTAGTRRCRSPASGGRRARTRSAAATWSSTRRTTRPSEPSCPRLSSSTTGPFRTGATSPCPT